MVVEAGPAAGVWPEEEEPQEATAARSSEVTNDKMEGDGGMTELTVYKSSSSSAAQEASVLCVVTDETTARRFNYSLPFSSAVTDLYAAVAQEAGVLFLAKISSHMHRLLSRIHTCTVDALNLRHSNSVSKLTKL